LPSDLLGGMLVRADDCAFAPHGLLLKKTYFEVALPGLNPGSLIGATILAETPAPRFR